MATTRTFNDSLAVRGETPLLVGLVGPSGTGKTYSALRLARGAQEVGGGDIGVIDTEAGRAKHYADKFKFRHLDFGAPFSPLDYLAAIEHFVKKGVKHIVIDSMSHEHEGRGGVLEMHSAELDRMAGNDYKKRDSMSMLAWSKPKQQRRRLLNEIVQMRANVFFCFRAKEKIKPVKGGQPLQLGWMPIAGEEFVYEMTLKFALLPGAGGVPSWRSEYPGEQAMMKLPAQFQHLFAQPRQLSEEIGRDLALWASGKDTAPASVTDRLIAQLNACRSPDVLEEAKRAIADAWKDVPKGAERSRVTAAVAEAKARVEAELAAPRKFDDDGDDEYSDEPAPASGTPDEDEQRAIAEEERRAASR